MIQMRYGSVWIGTQIVKTPYVALIMRFPSVPVPFKIYQRAFSPQAALSTRRTHLLEIRCISKIPTAISLKFMGEPGNLALGPKKRIQVNGRTVNGLYDFNYWYE